MDQLRKHSAVYGKEAAILAVATITLGIPAILGGKGLWQLGRGTVFVTKEAARPLWSATQWSASHIWSGIKRTPGGTGRGIKWTASTSWSSAKWAGRSSWKATKWTASTGFSITKYVIVNIPAAIKWTGLTLWGATKWTGRSTLRLTKWTFSSIRHPITTASNGFRNIGSAFSATYRFSALAANKLDSVFEHCVATCIKDQLDLAAKYLKSAAHDINKTAPITGRVASKTSRFHAAVYNKVIPYNPMPAIFHKAPSLKNPTYAATAAGASLLASAPLTWKFANQDQQYKAEAEHVKSCRWPDTNLENEEHSEKLKKSDAERQLFIELFTVAVGTMLLTPILAKHFSGDVVTKMQALVWGVLFGGVKTAHAAKLLDPILPRLLKREQHAGE